MTATAFSPEVSARLKSRPDDHRNSHRAEITRGRSPDRTLRWSANTSTGRPSTAIGCSEPPCIGRLSMAADRSNAGKRGNVRKKLVIETAALCFLGRPRNRHGHGEDVRRLEAGICPAQRPEAANHESGADEQNQRQRHFGDDQRVARPLAARVAVGLAEALLQRIVEIAAHEPGSGDQARRQSGEDGSQRGEGQHEAIHLHFGRAGHLIGQRTGDQRLAGARPPAVRARRRQSPGSSFRSAPGGAPARGWRPAPRGWRVPCGGRWCAPARDSRCSHRRSAERNRPRRADVSSAGRTSPTRSSRKRVTMAPHPLSSSRVIARQAIGDDVHCRLGLRDGHAVDEAGRPRSQL